MPRDTSQWRFETKSVHAGYSPEPTTHAVAVPLYHGRDDQTVPYLASSRTLQAMQARGAGSTVTLTDCNATPASHTGCVVPYFNHVLGQLAPLVRDL